MRSNQLSYAPLTVRAIIASWQGPDKSQQGFKHHFIYPHLLTSLCRFILTPDMLKIASEGVAVSIENVTLTPLQAYKAMYLFLERYAERFKGPPPEELSIILGLMRLLDDGKPADAAFGEYWDECVTEILSAESG